MKNCNWKSWVKLTAISSRSLSPSSYKVMVSLYIMRSFVCSVMLFVSLTHLTKMLTYTKKIGAFEIKG